MTRPGRTLAALLCGVAAAASLAAVEAAPVCSVDTGAPGRVTVSSYFVPGATAGPSGNGVLMEHSEANFPTTATARSWSFWIKVNGVGGTYGQTSGAGNWAGVFRKGANDQQRNPAAFLYPGDSRVYNADYTPDGTGNDDLPDRRLTLGEWEHYACVHVGGQPFECYLNGKRIDQAWTQDHSASALGHNTGHFYGHALNGGTYLNANAEVADLFYWSRALDASEIDCLFHGFSRAAELTTLSSIGVSHGALTPSFQAMDTRYGLVVPNDVASVTLAADPTHDGAAVAGDGVIALAEGTATEATITVSSATGGLSRDYTVAVHRLGAAACPSRHVARDRNALYDGTVAVEDRLQLAVASQVSPRVLAERTVSFWVRAHASKPDKWSTLLQLGDAEGFRCPAFFLHPGTLRLYASTCVTSAKSAYIVASSTRRLEPGRWTHVALRHRAGLAADGAVQFVIDGVPEPPLEHGTGGNFNLFPFVTPSGSYAAPYMGQGGNVYGYCHGTTSSSYHQADADIGAVDYFNRYLGDEELACLAQDVGVVDASAGVELESLSLGGGAVEMTPPFAAGETLYSAVVSAGTSQVAVAAAAPAAGGAVVSGATGTQALAAGKNELLVTVRSADGAHSRTYTVLVYRLAGSCGEPAGRVEVRTGAYRPEEQLVLATDGELAPSSSDTGELSYSFWVRLHSSGASHETLFAKSAAESVTYSSRHPAAWVRWFGSRQLYFASRQEGSYITGQAASAYQGFPLGEWAHVACRHRAGDFSCAVGGVQYEPLYANVPVSASSTYANGLQADGGTIAAPENDPASTLRSYDTSHPSADAEVGRLSYFSHYLSDEEVACLAAEPHPYVVGDCPAEALETTQPALDEAETKVAASGALQLEWVVPDRLTSAKWRFVGATDPAACDNAAGADAAPWERLVGAASECEDRVRFSRALPLALRDCGFSTEPQDGGDAWYYEAAVEVDAAEPAGTVFGADVSRTSTTAFRVRVELPKEARVDTSAVAWNSVIELGLLSSQASDPTSKLFTWEFATSVQEPYYLEAVSAAASPSGDFDDVAPAVSGTDVCSGVTGVCTQTFTVTATAGALVCSLDGTATLTFAVRCRDNFDGACDLALVAAETTQLSFSYRTDSFCARVAEVAQVTPSMTTSTTKGGASATDFVLQTTLHGRVALAVEGGVAVSRVHLAQLDIASEATVRAVENGAYAGSSDTKFLMSTADQVDGAAHVDFSFQLNTESVSFSAGGATGQATVTLTAVVEVTYADATLQRFTVETQAAAPPATTLPVAAQATIGVTSTAPAAGGSSSTAGSTVLGVSTGTAMVAGVGLVAVVALAAGAVLAVRKRRQSAARRLKASSSTVELNDTAAVQA